MRGRKRQRKKNERKRIRVRMLVGNTIEEASRHELGVAVGPMPSKLSRSTRSFVDFTFKEPVPMRVGGAYWVDIVFPRKWGPGKYGRLAQKMAVPQDHAARSVAINVYRTKSGWGGEHE